MNPPKITKITIAQRAEAVLVWLLLQALRLLPPAGASRLGGALAGALGPLIPVSRVADTNLRLAMPELDAPQRRRIVKDCWRNLGQTAAELVRLGDLREIAPGAKGPGFCSLGWEEHVAPALARGKADGTPVLFFTGHLGNWEILPVCADAHGAPFAFMYRAAGNPLVDAMIMRLRRRAHAARMFPKGAAGGRAAYAHLLGGGALGLLVDQKLDTGLSAPFFGREAMTMDALASFAVKFRCPVIPAHVARRGAALLDIIFDAPLDVPLTGEREADMRAITAAMNRTLEDWIRADPGAWLWLHRRWPRPLYRRG